MVLYSPCLGQFNFALELWPSLHGSAPSGSCLPVRGEPRGGTDDHGTPESPGTTDLQECCCGFLQEEWGPPGPAKRNLYKDVMGEDLFQGVFTFQTDVISSWKKREEPQNVKREVFQTSVHRLQPNKPSSTAELSYHSFSRKPMLTPSFGPQDISTQLSRFYTFSTHLSHTVVSLSHSCCSSF